MTDSIQSVIFAADAGIRDTLSALLEEKDIIVRPGKNEEEALQLVQALPPRLVVGVWDKGEDPLPFLKKLVSERILVLVISASVDVKLAVACIQAGALDFILLPFEEKRLEKIFSSLFSVKKEVKNYPVVSQDAGMKRLIELSIKIAPSRAPVFIQGESGTGKELFAKILHENSPRKDGPFVAVNCAALPENLLESELFGHEKGAFTGAAFKKKGKFELADGGTLLLDELSEMPIHLQAKLLRVLQESLVDRLGGSKPVKVDVRLIATSNRDLKLAIEEGIFREDLFHRLNTIPLRIPPLRKRRGDIPILARHFIEKYNAEDGKSVKALTKEALDILLSLEFTGNVRELENVIRRAVLLCDGEYIKTEDLLLDEFLDQPEAISKEIESLDSEIPESFFELSLKEIERHMIFHTLERFDGNRTHAAQLLGISVRTLRNKLNEYKSEAENPS